MSLSSGLLPVTLARALAARGHTDLTPVQAAVLAASGAGRDLVVSAPTGSGKTVAFGIALAEVLLGPDGRARPRPRPAALVVAPTRELAAQIAAELGWLYGRTGLRVACVTGATYPEADRAALRGAGLVVGTPGRLSDHLRQGVLKLGDLGALVLDEADDLIEGGFDAALDRLLAAVPEAARRHFLSATISVRVRMLAQRLQRRPYHVTVGHDADRAARLRLRAIAVQPRAQMAAVERLVAAEGDRGALVFCARREGVAALAAYLAGQGIQTVMMSGALSQRERRLAMSALRGGAARVCVSTDLAARGLVFPNLSLVVHAGLPVSAASLLHRSGRRGRSGIAVLVVGRHERRRAEAMAARAGFALDWDEG